MLSQTLKTRGLHVGVRFAPAAVLDKPHKKEYQLRSSEGFDWTRQEYADKIWNLASPQAEGDPRSHLKLTVQPDQVIFEDVFPVSPIEVFLDNLRMTLETAAEVFNLRIMLGSRAIIRMTADVNGQDARVFLGHRCLGLAQRLTPLGRPIHAVGLKMLLPPVPMKDQPPWQAEVKVESLVEDVRQLFIEVDAQWGVPIAWNIDEIIRRAQVARDFTQTQVVAFLTQWAEGKGE